MSLTAGTHLGSYEILARAAWAILSAGISEHVVRAKFDDISVAFLNWRSASEIAAKSAPCCRKTLTIFNHERKVRAIAARQRGLLGDQGETGIRRFRVSRSLSCEDIAHLTNDRVSVIDSVLWRYANLYRDYEEHFRVLRGNDLRHCGANDQKARLARADQCNHQDHSKGASCEIL